MTLRSHIRGAGVAFFPDGQRILSIGVEGTVKVCDADSGKELLSFKSDSMSPRSLALSPDGRSITSASEDGTVKVIDTANWRESIALRGHSAEVLSVVFSHDGRRIATAGVDRMAKLWDAMTGRELGTFKGHSDTVSCVAFSPDDQRIITGSTDGTAKIWDAATGGELLTLQCQCGDVSSVAFFPDGRQVLTAADQSCRVWESSTGRALFALGGRIRAFSCFTIFSPDGRYFVTGGWGGAARIWQAQPCMEVGSLMPAGGSARSAAFSPNGERIVTGSDDGSVDIWEFSKLLSSKTSSGALVTLMHSDSVTAVAFSPDSQRLATGCLDRMARVWDLPSGRELLTLKGHLDIVTSVAISPDGRRIATASSDKVARIWDALDGRELIHLKGVSNEVLSVAFSPDGRRLATGSKLWDAATGTELLTLAGTTSNFFRIDFTRDGKQVFGGGAVWDAYSGRQLVRFQGEHVYAMSASPDARRIVTCNQLDPPKMWDAATGQELLALKGHNDIVYEAAFSPDGRRVATCSWDDTIKLWDSSSGSELLTLPGKSSGIITIAFSPDGRRIASGGNNGALTVWEAATIEQVASWKDQDRSVNEFLAQLSREFNERNDRRATALEQSRIKHWLVLAPISLTTNESVEASLDAEQIGGEADLKPKAGDIRVVRGVELKWREVGLETSCIDFNVILGIENPRSVGYAVCYLRSNKDLQGLQMLVQNDDYARIYLNGQELYRSLIPHKPFFALVEDKVTGVNLKSGVNVVVFKVLNDSDQWQGSLRLTDASGNSVTGVEATLDPRTGNH